MILTTDYIGYLCIPVYSESLYIMVIRTTEWEEYLATPPSYKKNKIK